MWIGYGPNPHHAWTVHYDLDNEIYCMGFVALPTVSQAGSFPRVSAHILTTLIAPKGTNTSVIISEV